MFSYYITSMQSIFEYLDYRQYLRDFYEEQKKTTSYFSYRYVSRKVGLDAGYLVKVLQGRLHIPEKYIEAFCSLCTFSKKESSYFKTLINFNRAKSESQIKICFEKLMSFKSPGKNLVDKLQYEYYRKWYYSAIRSLVGIVSFSGDNTALSRMLTPHVSPREVKKAIKLLENLGLIRKDKSGVYSLTDTFVTTGESWRSLAIKDFQRETIRLAGESLDRHQKEDRDISTVTVAINKKDLTEAKARIADFRDTIFKLAENSNGPDSVFQLNVQLFPLAQSAADRS
jgi:uncharacterized protein (TIGR02147 family)